VEIHPHKDKLATIGALVKTLDPTFVGTGSIGFQCRSDDFKTKILQAIGAVLDLQLDISKRQETISAAGTTKLITISVPL
jgi:hypothetical protein